MAATEEGKPDDAKFIAQAVFEKLISIKKRYKSFIPSIEGVQNEVEEALMRNGFIKTARAYIIYREKHTEQRERAKTIPKDLKKLVDDSKAYFRNPLGEFIYYRTYARWIPKENRRETWIETVDRYMDFMRENLEKTGGQILLTPQETHNIKEAILNQEIMPSMRLMQFAGKAARATNVCAYNCAYIAPTCLEDFGEILYILMCGTGIGFSVESQNVQSLPQIKRQTGKRMATHVIPDSKEGWANVLVLGLKTWFSGKDIEFDYSKLRPAGARLKTFGGKSSGPEPLRALLNFARNKILFRQGRRLTNIDVHDIICKIAEIVVSGGVRRSATISLSDLDDHDMRDSKKGQFYMQEPQRGMANNSAVYERKPTSLEFITEFKALMESGSGERGIFNRGSLIKTLPKRRLNLLQEKGLIQEDRITGLIGSNPCGEIILQSKGFCNLTEVIARPEDNLQSLLNKVRLATILGTYQSMLTHFPYLSEEWKKNAEEERLLGVSITGQWDCKAARDTQVLALLKKETIATNKKYAARFGIGQSMAITCVKPSGTVSQLVDCASGMHARHAPYYIRRIRISATDSLFKMLKEQGVPYHPEIGQTEDNATTFVLEFPVKAPEGSIFRNDLTALQQLDHWKTVKEHYTEHNPSVTISVGEEEWIPVANWVYKHWDIVGGLSFLPRSNTVYQLAPYQHISEAHYHELTKKFKHVDFSHIVIFEATDNTEVKKELACVGGACEV
jgi:ribonucleoside-diphosphate reductase alpha chain